jgi:Flp pilus assembly pilin Flp
MVYFDHTTAGRFCSSLNSQETQNGSHTQTQRETTMLDLMKKFMRDEEGQDLVEYALLLVFLALAAIAVLPTLGSSVNRVFSQSNSSLNAS